MRGYIFQLTLVDSGNSKTWNCALSMQQLCSSQVIFSALQHTSKNSLWYKVPKDAPGSVDLATHMFSLTRKYDKKQEENPTIPKQIVQKFPSWQDGIFVVDQEIQFDVGNKVLLEPSQRVICMADPKSAPSISSKMFKEPSIDGLANLFVAIKNLMANNYPPACIALGGAVMSLGYFKIHQKYASCPVVLLTGDTETGKSTILRCCMSLFGDKNIRDYTKTKALRLASLNHMPFAWDDPTKAEDVEGVVQGLFNGAGKQTCHSDDIPTRPPIITANFACSKDKR
ncbi:uncharacterized protein LOC114574760 [Exaiptasia diaphana]|uniref:Uncharacterized protein n=1 Tax=Exaiptasia diaphana TaxID=2652724 RepID=A0A913YG41_EXADI|nr:uncharacterized protein LOC114574760 [Exaiptasia diaphana]